MRSYRILILLILLLTGCRNSNHTSKISTKEPISVSRFLMDTIVTISVHDSSNTPVYIQNAIERAFGTIISIEKIASVHMEGSELSLLNSGGAEKPTVISRELHNILKWSLEISRQTAGSFDPTIGSVKQLWDFNSASAEPPDSASVTRALSQVNFHNISMNSDSTVAFGDSVIIDLSGIAKGYAIDLAVASLLKDGITAGIVEAGGDLRIFGNHPQREAWGIGVKHPRNPNTLFGVIHTSESSIATSGDYERFFMYRGKRYHHLLDPGTGFPADHCISVTIRYPDALAADAYATAIFILGPQKGMALIESISKLEGLIIFMKAGKLQYNISTGLIDILELGS